MDARPLIDGNDVEIRTFLERGLDIVIGIEFIKMLAKHSPGCSLEVLLYAIARHLDTACLLGTRQIFRQTFFGCLWDLPAAAPPWMARMAFHLPPPARPCRP